MKDGLKLKTNKNNFLRYIPSPERDRVLGFVLKKANLLTKRYAGWIDTEECQKCPYCL